MVYGATVFVWIFVLAYTTIVSVVSADIINGKCVIIMHKSYVQEKAVSTLIFFIVYLLPLTLAVFCYSRIVYALRHKVKSHVMMTV